MGKNTEYIIEKNKQVYDEIARHFSDTRSFLWEDLVILRDFVKPGYKILDIGCGNGRLYQLFEGKSSDDINFFGIDISQNLVNLAKEQYPHGEFMVADMRKLPFGDGYFDVIFSLVAFHHLPDRDSQMKSLQEMKRVLKPGGQVVLINWNAYSDWVQNKLDKGDYEYMGKNLFRVPWKRQDKQVIGDRVYYGFTLSELESLFEEVGLNLEEQYFLRHGERVDVKSGMNLVSIVRK